MTDCIYCHKPALNNQDITNTANHKVCVLEYNKRHENGICVRCGKNTSPYFLCDRCVFNDLDYSGYIGPV